MGHPENNALEWISTRHLQHLVAQGDTSGLPMDSALTEAGWDRTRLADPEGVVPLSAVEVMMMTLAKHRPDPLLGLHMAHNIKPAALGALGLMFQACHTFADVLDTAARFSGLLGNVGHTSVAHLPGRVAIRWESLAGSAAFRHHASDYVLGTLVSVARLLMPNIGTYCLEVHVPHARPVKGECVREYFDLFQAPVTFDEAHAAVTLSSEVLGLHLHHGDAFLKDLLERHAYEQMQRRQETRSLADDVGRLIRALILNGIPDRDVVAAQLGMSGRTLHRKLQEVGTSYRGMLDTVRIGMALEGLKDPHVTIADMTVQLGFSSPQVFLRWFRQCMGMTPGQFRQARQPEKPMSTEL